MPSAVDGQGRAGDVRVVQQVAQALVDHFTAGLDAQRGLGQGFGALRRVVVGVEQ